MIVRVTVLRGSKFQLRSHREVVVMRGGDEGPTTHRQVQAQAQPAVHLHSADSGLVTDSPPNRAPAA